MTNFFHQYRVKRRRGEDKGKIGLPMQNSVDCAKRHLKSHIQRNCPGNFDITNEVDFPVFTRFWKGYKPTLKSKGLGDTRNNPSLPKRHRIEINKLLVLLHQVMIGDPFMLDKSKSPPVRITNPEYTDLLKKVPKVCLGELKFSLIFLRHNYANIMLCSKKYYYEK